MLQNTCENFCVNGSCNSNECDCNPGFIGQYCDMQLCGDHICNNQSTCENLSGNSVCQCYPGLKGEFCEQGNLKGVFELMT